MDWPRLTAFALRVSKETKESPIVLAQPITTTRTVTQDVPGGWFKAATTKSWTVSETVSIDVGVPCFVLDRRFYSAERDGGSSRYAERTERAYCLTAAGALVVQTWSVSESASSSGLVISWMEEPSTVPMSEVDVRLFDFLPGSEISTSSGERFESTDVPGQRLLYDRAGVGLSVRLKRMLGN